MRYRPLGKTEFEISELGHGLWGMGSWSESDDRESLEALRTSVAIGVNLHGLGAALIGGWQVNLLYEWDSGTPTSMPNGILRQPTAKLSHRTRDRWFDNSTKSNPHPDGTYAWDTLPPNAFRVAGFRMHDVRDPSITNSAVSLFKNTRAGNGTVQLRFEVFNVLNRRVYGGPNTSISSAQFGRITPNQLNFPRTGQVGVRYMF